MYPDSYQEKPFFAYSYEYKYHQNLNKKEILLIGSVRCSKAASKSHPNNENE
jgi:hypothetical protein